MPLPFSCKFGSISNLKGHVCVELEYLRMKGVALKHLKCVKEAASSGVEVHRMTMKGFQATYVVYGWSYGSGGGTQDLLVTSDAAVMQTQCWGD